MNLFEIQETLIITERKINELNTIKTKLKSRLLDLNARITEDENMVIFSRSKLYSTFGTLMSRYESLGFMREGKVVIYKESHSIKISWAVKLDSLYFFAFFSSVIAGMIASFSIEIILVFCIGIIFFLSIVFAGIVFIKVQMNELILSSVYKN
jgi:hypothetical protein